MKQLTTDQQMLGFFWGCRARMNIRDAVPCDREALAAISSLVSLVAPDFDEMSAWEKEHGLPQTSFETYVDARDLIAADIIPGNYKETRH